MKVFVRDWERGLFFRLPSEWVESLFEATDFGDVVSAGQQVSDLQKSNLEIFLTSDERNPIGGFRPDRPRV